MVLRDIIGQGKEEGKIIILSTHQMAEVEKIADRIYLINQGHMILNGSMQEIRSRFKENAYLIESEDKIEAIKDISDIKILEEHNQSCKISIDAKGAAKRKIIQSLFDKMSITKFIQVEPSLNDIFIKLIQSDQKN
jgi:ABC-2 type transport system ATP-binding protein